jgi:hypothetical protein
MKISQLQLILYWEIIVLYFEIGNYRPRYYVILDF